MLIYLPPIKTFNQFVEPISITNNYYFRLKILNQPIKIQVTQNPQRLEPNYRMKVPHQRHQEGIPGESSA